MRIICDVDNVIVDWQMSWITKYEAEFDTRVPWETRGRWDCYSAGTHFTSYDEFSEWLGDAFWWDINKERVPGAVNALFAAERIGHTILLATHRPDGAPKEAATELARRLMFPVEFASPLEKADLPGDVWVDDSAELHWDLKRRGLQGIRFVCPWNEGAPGIPMADWSEFAGILKGLVK